MSLLQKIQQKPVYVRKILMVVCVMICAGLIFAFWLNSIKNTILRAGQPGQNMETANNQAATMPSFKQTIVSGIADIIHLFKSGKQEFEKIKSSPEQVIPEQIPESEPSLKPDDILPEIKPHRLP